MLVNGCLLLPCLPLCGPTGTLSVIKGQCSVLSTALIIAPPHLTFKAFTEKFPKNVCFE